MAFWGNASGIIFDESGIVDCATCPCEETVTCPPCYTDALPRFLSVALGAPTVDGGAGCTGDPCSGFAGTYLCEIACDVGIPNEITGPVDDSCQGTTDCHGTWDGTGQSIINIVSLSATECLYQFRLTAPASHTTGPGGCFFVEYSVVQAPNTPLPWTLDYITSGLGGTSACVWPGTVTVS